MPMPLSMSFIKSLLNPQTNDLINISFSIDEVSNIRANSYSNSNKSENKTISELIANSKSQNMKEKDGFYGTTYADDPLNITKRVINPLYFEILSPEIKDLLEKRNCTSFPCFQELEYGPDIFDSRKMIYEEGCDVSKDILKVKFRWAYKRTIWPKSRKFSVCTIPKVRSYITFLYKPNPSTT